MKRVILGTLLLNGAGWLALGQPSDAPPKFEIADVHVSAKSTSLFPRTSPVRGGRYELKNATMVDLVRTAYGFDADKILGGPNWLEMNRYDVIAKVPDGSTPETQKQMLQALLEDRFKLMVHKEDKPLPTYALTVGKKLQIKEAEGTEETGCRPQTGSGGPGMGGVVMMSSLNGAPTSISLGPGMTITYQCRNITMAAFAAGLRSMMGASMGLNPVLDETGLKGKFNFDVRWSIGISLSQANQGDHISAVEAVDKQLGLKLEEKPVPTPVIVVDSVNADPGENPLGVAEALPTPPMPKEFEVAVINPTDPNERMGRFQMQPGGRLIAQGMPMRFLISRAFNAINNDQIAGLPKWADTERFDITAAAPSAGPSTAALDNETLEPMIRALLVDRFKMTYHSEERPVSTYALVSVKPKMKKADPASRTSCKNSPAPPGSPPGSQTLTCQNFTMAQFADRLKGMAPELGWPVADATGLEGSWDFTLIFSRNAAMLSAMGRSALDAGQPGGTAAASDPNGAITVFEALEKQLGLKLELRKRPMPVFVIDHIEQKPTEN